MTLDELSDEKIASRFRYEWTPERDKQLLELLARGWSASQIAKPMKTTRSAILARKKRLRDSGVTISSSDPQAARVAITLPKVPGA